MNKETQSAEKRTSSANLDDDRNRGCRHFDSILGFFDCEWPNEMCRGSPIDITRDGGESVSFSTNFVFKKERKLSEGVR